MILQILLQFLAGEVWYVNCNLVIEKKNLRLTLLIFELQACKTKIKGVS